MPLALLPCLDADERPCLLGGRKYCNYPKTRRTPLFWQGHKNLPVMKSYRRIKRTITFEVNFWGKKGASWTKRVITVNCGPNQDPWVGQRNLKVAGFPAFSPEEDLTLANGQ